MFQELVSPRARDHRSWYTLPLSFAVHTAIIAVLVVVPLIATDLLPEPRTALEYINSDFTPAVPTPPPPAPRRDLAHSPLAHVEAGVPLVTPDGISMEKGVIFDDAAIPTRGIDDVVSGLGVVEHVIDGPPPPVETSVPVRPGGDIKPPVRTRYVPPRYPEIARANRIEGIVIIEAIIGTDGRVDNARVLRSSPFLDEVALEAVRAWEYTPTLLNGRPTAVIMTVTVRFDLK
jgi:protein TonB